MPKIMIHNNQKKRKPLSFFVFGKSRFHFAVQKPLISLRFVVVLLRLATKVKVKKGKYGSKQHRVQYNCEGAAIYVFE
jgi:hypothetical protein